jgi:glycosyltransferase involved in cell wall biosynthesis
MKALIQTGSSLSACGHAQAGGRVPVPLKSDFLSIFAAIEAMSMGLPVLTTDCAWVPRLVADGAGIVVPVGDAEAFAAALKKLADNPALRQRMGAAGRQQVLERHTWPASADALKTLYSELIIWQKTANKVQ